METALAFSEDESFNLQNSPGYLIKAREIAAQIKDVNTIPLGKKYLNVVDAQIDRFKAWMEPKRKAAHESWNLVTKDLKTADDVRRQTHRIISDRVTFVKQREDAERREREAKLNAALPKELKELGGSVKLPPVKVEGAKQPVKWRARVLNKRELIKAVLSGKISEDALQVNSAYCDEQADKFKENLAVPGLEAYREDGLSL